MIPRCVLGLFLASTTALAQVQVSLSVVPFVTAKRLLNSRAAKIVSPWTGTARNAGAERVIVTESAILAQIARLQPLDRVAMQLVIADAAQYSLLARLGRGGQDLTAVGAFVAGGWHLVAPWPTVLAGVAWGGPYLVSRLRVIQKPVGDSYAALAAGWPLALEPGGTLPFHVFTARQADNAQPVTFVLQAGAAVRMVQ